MAQPEVENRTPFAFAPLFIADEGGRAVLAPIVKATYGIGARGTLELAEEQRPVSFAGEHFGDPGESSLKYEPETAFVKPSTDVVLIGQACAPRPEITQVHVDLEVGPLKKTVRVTGDRRWEKGLLGPRMSQPQPFEKIPLLWERAYGGWDTSHANPEKHAWEPRNPVGVGFRNRRAKFEEGAPLPNLEDPEVPLTKYTGRSRPAGFGFVSPNWEPRASLAGTYDQAWHNTRMPLLPTDFQRRFFNAAPEDLTAANYLRGDEPVLVLNATPGGRLSFCLPGLVPPECLVTRRQARDEVLTTKLDTVIVNVEDMQLILLWRSFTTLREGPLEVRSMRITCESYPERRAQDEVEQKAIPLFPEAAPVATQGA